LKIGFYRNSSMPMAYLKQSIATPQVLTPALVERVGSNWRVQQLGTIAVPV
jgi:hypothetical protein